MKVQFLKLVPMKTIKVILGIVHHCTKAETLLQAHQTALYKIFLGYSTVEAVLFLSVVLRKSLLIC